MGIEVADARAREQRARVAARGVVGRRDSLRRVTLLPFVGGAEDAAVEPEVELAGGALDVAEEVLAGLRL